MKEEHSEKKRRVSISMVVTGKELNLVE